MNDTNVTNAFAVHHTESVLDYCSPRRKHKRWGWEHVFVETKEYCVKYLHMTKNQNCSWHYHGHKHETVTCICGVLHVAVEKDEDVKTYLLHPGESLALPPWFVHQMYTMDVAATYVESSGSGYQDDAIRVNRRPDSEILTDRRSAVSDDSGERNGR